MQSVLLLDINNFVLIYNTKINYVDIYCSWIKLVRIEIINTQLLSGNTFNNYLFCQCYHQLFSLIVYVFMLVSYI